MDHPAVANEAIMQLRRINAQFIANHIANDVNAHAALLHEQFCHISSSGRRIARAEYLKGWATGFDPKRIPYWDTRDERITVLGNLGLVYACNKFVEADDRSSTTGMAAYTDTYVFERGCWLCLQAQITNVAEQHWPADETIISVYIDGVLRP